MISSLPGGMDDTGPIPAGQPNPLGEQFDLVENLIIFYEGKTSATVAAKIPTEIEALKKLARGKGLGGNGPTMDKIDQLELRFKTAKRQANKKTYPIADKFYSHSSKEGQEEDGVRLGFDLEGQAFDNYLRSGYEIEFDVMVYEDGTVEATHVNGVALVEPVEI